jgi:hypothetical protein
MIVYGKFCFDKEIRYYKTSGGKKFLPNKADFTYRNYELEYMYLEGEENAKWRAIEKEINDSAKRHVKLINKRIINPIKLSESYVRKD